MKNDIAEMIKTRPELFDDQDCQPGGEKDKFWTDFHNQSNEHLPDYLKQALESAKSKRQPEPQPA